MAEQKKKTKKKVVTAAAGTVPEAETEREIGLRLVASRALIDQEFFDQLRANPQQAAAAISVKLKPSDVRRLRELDWDNINAHIEELRKLVPEPRMMRGAW